MTMTKYGASREPEGYHDNFTITDNGLKIGSSAADSEGFLLLLLLLLLAAVVVGLPHY